MADVFTQKKRSEVMSRIKGRGNKETEETLASMFRSKHISGWTRHADVEGKPDFSFRKQQVAIFVDGCFWHLCPWHSNYPKSNTTFWRKKLEGNKRRDRIVNSRLRRGGWHVLRIWQHQLERDPERVLARVTKALSARRRWLI